MAISVLLADDHQIFSDGLSALLKREPDVIVVGRASDGQGAVKLAGKANPDVVIMDLSMPGMNGIEACRRIVDASPEVKVLCLSMHADRRFVSAALEAGASGYVLKDCDLEEFVRAVRAVSRGNVYLSPNIAGTVVAAYKERRFTTDPSAFTVLSERQREILQLIAEGHPTRDIAERLGLSPKTVSTHREQIMAKLDIHSVAGLTKYAIREGLTSAEG